MTQTVLLAGDGVGGDQFGRQIAASADGSTIVVAAAFAAGGEGRVYAYTGAGYTTETELGATVGSAPFDLLGLSVAVSDDGSVIVAGAPNRSGGGAAYVFHGPAWATVTTLTASDADPSFSFGVTVAVAGDGTKVAVGNSVEQAYVYTGANWVTEAIITASDATSGDGFGGAVALSGDGSTLAVGAPNFTGGTNRGKVYIYTGAAWATEASVVASDAVDNDFFGSNVRLSGDGAVLAVGILAPRCAYVYSGVAHGTQTILTHAGTDPADVYGASIAVSGDGATVAVGAWGYAAGANRGRAYLYSGPGFATEDIISATDFVDGDSFGTAVALTGDASLAAVGAADHASSLGKAYVVTLAAPALSDGGRVSIAFDDPALEPDPNWTVIDSIPNLVAGIDIHRGRQTELDVTETSTATVLLNDTTGLFDPNNTDSPYFGVIDGKQILLQSWNPVTLEWVSLWRGHIDDYGYDFDPAVNAAGEPLVANVAIQCVDLFEYLASVEMIVGTFGDPGGPDGVVFYEDTDFQTRLTHLATDALLPVDFYSFFTGNVNVQSTRYDPGDSVLVAMRDAVGAEFPGIANLFTDRFGRVVAHGRLARFDPETTAIGSDWIFTRWKAGDGAAIGLDADRAQIRPPLTWGRPRSRIFNAATAYPRFPVLGIGGGTFTEADMAGQTVVDTTSRDAYGYRAFPAMSDLITLAGTTTGNDAKDETKLFAEYYVANYKDPRTRVEALTFKSIRPDDPRAPATWALLTAFDISDVVNLEHGYPGGEGIDEDFYIEGGEMSIRPLNAEYDLVELTLNVSPAAYFTDDVFTP